MLYGRNALYRIRVWEVPRLGSSGITGNWVRAGAKTVPKHPVTMWLARRA
jgi:hypothetical protein